MTVLSLSESTEEMDDESPDPVEDNWGRVLKRRPVFDPGGLTIRPPMDESDSEESPF